MLQTLITPLYHQTGRYSLSATLTIITAATLTLCSCNNTGSDKVAKTGTSASIDVDSSAAGVQMNQRASEVRASIGGKYSFGQDIEKGPVGSISIHPLTDTTALFYLNVNRGAPSYNMGMLYGQMTVENDVATYDGRTTDGGDNCLLTFKFGKGQVEVKTDSAHDNCGFGHAVYADHTFALVDSTIPQYYIDATGDTVLFKIDN